MNDDKVDEISSRIASLDNRLSDLQFGIEEELKSIKVELGSIAFELYMDKVKRNKSVSISSVKINFRQEEGQKDF